MKLAIEGGQPAVQPALPHIRDASGRSIGDTEWQEVREVLASGTLAVLYGNKAKTLEQQFAKAYGVRYAAACSSGTAALHTAVTYINPSPGDEIIVSPLTDMGSVIPILYQNAIPIFADTDPDTFNLTADAIAPAITKRTKAIMVTHLFGLPCDMDPIMALANKHQLPVIEDCAQAHWTRYKDRLVGTIGEVGCFSFQQSKHMTTGDGGMVITNQNQRFGRELGLCADKGWPRQEPLRDHLFLAANYHITELQAAVGLGQLKKLAAMVEARRTRADELTRILHGTPAITPPHVPAWAEHSYFYYPFTLDPDGLTVSCRQFVEALNAEGVHAELGYPGKPLYHYDVLMQGRTYGHSRCPLDCPRADRQVTYAPGDCPQAEEMCNRTVILHWNERLSSAHVHQIAAAIKKVLAVYSVLPRSKH